MPAFAGMTGWDGDRFDTAPFAQGADKKYYDEMNSHCVMPAKAGIPFGFLRFRKQEGLGGFTWGGV